MSPRLNLQRRATSYSQLPELPFIESLVRLPKLETLPENPSDPEQAEEETFPIIPGGSKSKIVSIACISPKDRRAPDAAQTTDRSHDNQKMKLFKKSMVKPVKKALRAAELHAENVKKILSKDPLNRCGSSTVDLHRSYERHTLSIEREKKKPNLKQSKFLLQQTQDVLLSTKDIIRKSHDVT